jgi:PAS domain S-box-containing protein
MGTSVHSAYKIRISFGAEVRAIEEYFNGYSTREEAEEEIKENKEIIATHLKRLEEEVSMLPENTLPVLKSLIEKETISMEKLFILKLNGKLESGKLEMKRFDQYVEDIDDISNRIHIHLSNLNNKWIENSRTLAQQFIFISIILAIVLCLFAIIASILFSRTISNPILKLTKASKILGSGNLSARVNIQSKDEIGELANAFNQMIDNLQNITVSKQYVDNIITSMSDILIVLETNGTIKTVNESISLLLGYRSNELFGKPLQDILGEGLVFKDSHLEKLITEGRLKDYNLTFKSKEGKRIQLSVNGSTLRNPAGELIGIVLVARDLRQIQDLMNQIDYARLFSEAIISTLPTGVIVLDNTLKILSTNPGVKHIFSNFSKGVLADYFNQKEVVVALKNVVIHQTPFYDFEVSLDKNNNNTPKVIILSAIPLTFARKGNNSPSILLLIEDITQQKSQEQAIQKTIQHADSISKGDYSRNIELRSQEDTLGIALQKMIQTLRDVSTVAEEVASGNLAVSVKEKGSQDRLAKSINHMVNTLLKTKHENEKMKMELLQAPSLLQSQKMEVVGRLAGGIAHDFNNALGVIHPTVQLLISETKDLALLESYKVIIDSAEQAKNVVKQLLQFARQQDTIKEAINLNTILCDIKPVLIKIIGKQNTITIQTTSDPIVIYGDASQIQQVILNIAINANDSMCSRGEGEFTIQLTTHDIDNEDTRDPLIQSSKYVKISLSDTGKGMSKEIKDQIFSPFFTTKPQGTGLGLSVSIGVIQHHGGMITCDSEEGVGTTFDIQLPLHKIKDEGPKKTMIRQLVDGQGKKVLIIDDEKLVGRVTSNVLKKLNYTIDYVDNITDGLTKYKKSGHDIIILDYQMDDIDGIEGYYRLKKSNPNIKVVLYTGDLYSDRVRKFSEKESVPLLYKPLDIYQMSDILITLSQLTPTALTTS